MKGRECELIELVKQAIRIINRKTKLIIQSNGFINRNRYRSPQLCSYFNRARLISNLL